MLTFSTLQLIIILLCVCGLLLKKVFIFRLYLPQSLNKVSRNFYIRGHLPFFGKPLSAKRISLSPSDPDSTRNSQKESISMTEIKITKTHEKKPFKIFEIIFWKESSFRWGLARLRQVAQERLRRRRSGELRIDKVFACLFFSPRHRLKDELCKKKFRKTQMKIIARARNPLKKKKIHRKFWAPSKKLAPKKCGQVWKWVYR